MGSHVPKAAHFNHPVHGTYTCPNELVTDKRLSETEKQMVIEAWSNSLKHGTFEERDIRSIKATARTLSFAATRLAAGNTQSRGG
ncbi:hypothetical protein [Jiella mangrovi]|uniref:Uncharacterized protein n=1 Tax=Jiella mangrovi TaxID=2821407 RepID=A0ABS4BC68_9HYPH|nr:hypothetical protein [Jiella mangrovi]MBP0614137.1 hypothetical protein [Jiella mangrovi]